MKKDGKQRLFEVMGRLDKSFKPKLNEDFSNEIPTDDASQVSDEAPKELSPEEKLQELTAKVDEMYALLHGEEKEVEPEMGDEENLQEWNFDKKKGEKKEDKDDDDDDSKEKFNFKKKEDKESKEHEKSETPEEEKEEHKEKEEIDEAKPKLPVAAIAKVGK